MSWHDPRGAETVEQLRARFGEELEYRIGQRLRTVSSVAKLGWLAGHGRLAGVTTWLGVPELVLCTLTGSRATEHSLASRTGCYDVAARAWLPEVADAAGLPAAALPPVLTAGVPMGWVTDAGADWSGLPPGIPVTLAGHDHLVGAEAVGTGPGDALNSVGTAETVLRRTEELPDVRTALDRRLAISVRPGGPGWTVLASAARSGAVLTTAARTLGRSPADLDALAAVARDEVYAASLLGPLARGEPVELPDVTPGALWAGLLHALAEAAAEAGTRLSGLLGDPPRRLVAYGGGTVSREWMSEKARLLSMPVLRSTVTEAAARGAAVLAGVAVGWWPSAEAAPPSSLEPVTL
jgi:xylulokinase